MLARAVLRLGLMDRLDECFTAQCSAIAQV